MPIYSSLWTIWYSFEGPGLLNVGQCVQFPRFSFSTYRHEKKLGNQDRSFGRKAGEFHRNCHWWNPSLDRAIGGLCWTVRWLVVCRCSSVWSSVCFASFTSTCRWTCLNRIHMIGLDMSIFIFSDDIIMIIIHDFIFWFLCLKYMTEFGSGGAGAQGLPARCTGILGIPRYNVVSFCHSLFARCLLSNGKKQKG